MIDVVARVLAVMFLPFARSTHARNETSVVALPRTFSEIQRAESVMTSGADHPDPAILADRRREHEDLKRRGVTQDALDGPAPLEMWAALKRVSQGPGQLSFPHALDRWKAESLILSRNAVRSRGALGLLPGVPKGMDPALAGVVEGASCCSAPAVSFAVKLVYATKRPTVLHFAGATPSLLVWLAGACLSVVLLRFLEVYH